MRFLLTGSSSFTGSWFATILARDGHAVTGTLQGRIADYPPLTAARIGMMRDAGVALAEGAGWISQVSVLTSTAILRA